MPELSFRRKVVSYITCDGKLMVFRHRDYPDVGIQVPAGSVEEGEDLAAAALREGQEESGLENLQLVKYLGTENYDISILRPELHERHFFHLQTSAPVPQEWLHYEMTPSGGDRKPIAFNCFWVDLQNMPQLFLGFDAMIHKIKS